MRSYLALAVASWLIDLSTARATDPLRALIKREATSDADEGVLDWFKGVVRRQTLCDEDAYYNFVNNNTFGQQFCEAYYAYPNTTITVEYTPTR